MDHGTQIFLFNLWALLLTLFLMRAYQNRSVRIQMVRTYNRSRVGIHRLQTWYRRGRGRLLIALGRMLLWMVNRLQASLQPGRKIPPQRFPMRLLRSLFGSLFGLLPLYFILQTLTGHAPEPRHYCVYFLVVCLRDESKFQWRQWQERKQGNRPQPEVQSEPGQSVALRKIAEEDSA